MTIKAYLRPYTNADGLQQVRIIVSDKGKRTVISTPVFVAPKYWDGDKCRVKPNAPNAAIINQAIALKLSEIQKDVFSGVVKHKKIGLHEFIDGMLRKLSERVKPVSLGVYRSNAKKLKDFAPTAKVNDITTDFMERFETYCRKELGNNDGGVNNSMQFVIQVANNAIRKGIINPVQIAEYKQKSYNPSEKTYLTRDEIDQWAKALESPELTDRHIQAGYYFLLSCYTGLRHRDCMKLNSSLNVNGRLVLYTNKTGTPVSLKMNPEVLALFNKCLSLGKLPANNATNPFLNKVAKLAGIKKHISFHSSRHSFAVNCANLGIPIEVTSKLLGHTNLATTSIYYKLANPVLDKAMEKWI